MIMTEIERIQNHLLWFGTAANNIGFQTLFMESWKIRTIAMDIMEKICGARIFVGMNVPGGTRFDIPTRTNVHVRNRIKTLIPRVRELIREIDTNELLQTRWKNVGILNGLMAKKLGVVGPTARASGQYLDVRKNQPYLVYSDINFRLIREKNGDCFSRARVRLREVLESINIIQQGLEQIPSKGKVIPDKVDILPEGKNAVAREAPRGEDFHYLESAGGKSPSFIRIRAPTYANLQSISEMCKDAKLADVPVILNSIDPCFACCDRLTVINEENEVAYVELD
jgi:Ni,Fe-hydrogenase III large subunit